MTEQLTRAAYIARLKEVWGEAWERHDEWPDLPAWMKDRRG